MAENGRSCDNWNDKKKKKCSSAVETTRKVARWTKKCGWELDKKQKQ